MRKILIVALCLIYIHLWAGHVRAFQQHSVKEGDTLYRIARTYGTSVNNLTKANNLRSTVIRPGDVIIIHSDVVGSNNSISQEKTRLALHTVEKGESLYSISLQYNITVKELRGLNNIRGSVIRAGETLFVPFIENTEELPDVTTESMEDTSIALNMAEEPEPDAGNVTYNDNEIMLTGFSRDDEVPSSLLKVASDYIGVPYRFGGETLRGIDCSAFVQRVFRYFSIDLPRTAREQFKAGVRISKRELRIGDLIFFTTYAKYPSHVGIYIGEGKMIHASSRSKKVTISNIEDPYYVRRYIGSVRLPTDSFSSSRDKIQTISAN